jgi:hypothetical protein
MECKKVRENIPACTEAMSWERKQERTLERYSIIGDERSFDKHVEYLMSLNSSSLEVNVIGQVYSHTGKRSARVTRVYHFDRGLY